MRLDFTTFRIFLAVLEEQNISKAADREHIAASAVSKRIQDMEDALQVKLLHRHVKGVTPTAAGEALGRHLRSLFGIVDRMRGELSEHAHGASGHVLLCAHGSAIVESLAEDLRSFAAAYPGVTVDLREALSPDVVRAVHEGLADIGVYASNVAVPPGMQTYPWRIDHLVAVVPAGHALAGRGKVKFEDLLDYEHIGVDNGSALAELLSQMARRLKRPIRFNFSVRTNEVVRCMVSKGFGVAILPEGFVTPYAELLDIRAIPLSDRWARRQLNLCVRDRQGLTAAARRMVEHLLRDAPPQ